MNLNGTELTGNVTLNLKKNEVSMYRRPDMFRLTHLNDFSRRPQASRLNPH